MNIIFEFVGGPLDGNTVSGVMGQQDEADRYYVLTHHGRLGQRFRIASHFAIETLAREELRDDRPHHFQQHSYEVTERVEDGNEVLVRVTYVGRDRDTRPVLVREHLEPTRRAPESSEEAIGRFLEQTAQSMVRSYSHCWPAYPRAGGQPAKNNIMLHLAHVLLNSEFTVFADALHPDPRTAAADLLAFAPSQDWFLACGFSRLDSARHLTAIMKQLQRLATFWPGPQLTIDACHERMLLQARHCTAGYAVLAGQHFAPANRETRLLAFWKTRQGHGRIYSELSERLEQLQATWHPAIPMQTFAGRGTYYLLAITFRVPH